MTDKNITPEERLFEIIQKESTIPAGPESGSEKTKHSGKARMRVVKDFFFRNAGVFTLKNFFLTHPRFKFNFKFSDISLTIVNKALIFVLVLFSAVVFYSFSHGRLSVEGFLRSMPKAQFSSAAVKAVGSFEDLSYYANEAKKRNIFRQFAEEGVKPIIQAFAPEPLDDLKKLVAGLKLQGITWGRVSKVMLYNENEGKMYFLKEGDPIGATGVRVKTILRNKIIVSCGEAEMEIM